MKAFLPLLFAISSLGALAQTSNVKQDTGGVSILTINDYFGRPTINGFHYTYTASLAGKIVTSTITVDYGNILPKDGVTIAIYDTTGKLMQSPSNRHSGGRSIVDLSSSIKPGEYRIVVYQGDNRVLLREIFIKQ